MKIHTIILLIIAAFFAPLAIFAADAAPATVATVNDLPWQLALIPLLTPLIISCVKILVPKIPGAIIPTILAPVLGIVLDLVSHLTMSTSLNIWLAMGLGLAGVGLREIKDQLTKPPETDT